MLPIPFAKFTTYAGHSGVDFPYGTGTLIRASGPGRVTYRGWLNGNAGYSTQVAYDNGPTVLYCHQPNVDRIPAVGTRVSEGSVIGQVGSTGRSTGPHLHMEIMVGRGAHTYAGVWNYFTKGSVVGSGGGSTGGSANVAGGQRTASAVVNRRSAPSSSASIAGAPLQPGAIGNFTGWKRGEAVNGNDVWYQGTSGHWFWSGGFKEGANGTGLRDLNPAAPPAVSPTQRVVGSNTANRRKGSPSSSAPAGEPLAPGTVGNFTHWTRGESVQGNDVWFKGTSGDYFWSGGFVGGANTAGLPEEARTPTPAPSSNQRKVKASDSVNGRNAPTTKGTSVVQSLAPGTVADFKGYVIGEEVEGNAFWLVGAYAGNYFWSGGFEEGANMAGLTKLDAPAPGPTTPPVPAQPGAVKVTPVYPGAKEGWDTPRGREKREKFGDRPGIQVDTAAVHYTGNAADNLEYFKGSGQGSVPTWFVRPNGDIFEMCRPDLRPVTTYKANNFTVSWEIQMLADGTVSLESLEAVAKCMAWLADQKEINGVPFKYVLDRAHTKGHREFSENTTACPGDFVMARIDSLVERAKAIRAGAPDPKPVDPKPSDPSTPGDTVAVDRSWLGSLWEKLGKLLGK